jgi:hypothetical protein
VINFPVQHIGANVPQAWAAGSAFMLTQALLGILPDAPRSKLYVDLYVDPRHGCPIWPFRTSGSAGTGSTSASGARAARPPSRSSRTTPSWWSAAIWHPGSHS